MTSARELLNTTKYPKMKVTVDDTEVDVYLSHVSGVYSGTDNVADINYSVPGRNRRYLSYFDSDENIDPTGYFKP